MPEYWLDTDSFATPARSAYRFTIMPKFWDYLEKKATERVIGSVTPVFTELTSSDDLDTLGLWVRKLNDSLFQVPDARVQDIYSDMADAVIRERRYKPQHIAKFLSGADLWLIAQAKVMGGRVVTFEKSEPLSSDPKIPDVAHKVDVHCLNIYDMLSELGAKF